MTLNKELLKNPEVREIAEAYAQYMGFPLTTVWDNFVTNSTRTPVLVTCKEDGAQEVYELNENIYWCAADMIYCGSAETIISNDIHKQKNVFKSCENAENYLLMNYKFTVEEVFAIISTWRNSPEGTIESFFITEARKRLGL